MIIVLYISLMIAIWSTIFNLECVYYREDLELVSILAQLISTVIFIILFMKG
nr:MAG TPA: hypothetical protein [Caudoviricetes sp.]